MPPGTTTTVTTPSALVIAPHFDDDVLGCGGLIAQLADAGAEVTVLFVTDGSGGVEEVQDRPAYAERRHSEAMAALEILGVRDIIFADLPDGSVAEHLEEAADAVRSALLEKRPRLLLTISPLEISPDHRATFTAVHEVLASLRGGTELDEVARDLDILLYEANHPAFPDVLVDVSAEIDRVRRAIEAHASQLERHNYREMTLGLRSLRTASLPTAVTAAEGFRRLTANDFVTHSRADMIRRLGGVAELHDVADGPMISVIVRTKDRPQLLAEALASLAGGTYRRVEVVLVNDGGDPPEVDAEYPLPVVRVDFPDNRGRAAAANAGIEAASGEWIAFLDDDDLAAPEHLATLAGLTTAAGTRVVYTDAAVGVYEVDPDRGWREVERRLPYSRDFDPELLLFDNYIPFNTLLIERKALREAGPLDNEFPFFEDWELLIRLAAITPFHHFARVTAEYRHFRGGSHILGEHPGDRTDFLDMKARVIERHRERHTPELLARVVDGLRAETVAALEGSAGHASESSCLSQSRAELIHELNQYRNMVGERDATLRDLYAEIERLNAVLDEMQGTKAWRLHRLGEKLRGR